MFIPNRMEISFLWTRAVESTKGIRVVQANDKERWGGSRLTPGVRI
jgi:hypothetical protein